MSVHDIVESANEWLAAIAEHEAAEEAFRGFAMAPQGGELMDVYQRMIDASRASKAAQDKHLAAVKDIQNDGVSDDIRIVALRTENGRLRGVVKKLRFELNTSRENNEERNRALDALHFIWCDGGCDGGAHRYCDKPEDLTEEVVQAAERNTKRMRTWLTNSTYRAADKAQIDKGA